MPPPPEPEPEPLNLAMIALATQAAVQLDPIWVLPPTDITQALFDVLPTIVDEFGSAASTAAADWYDQLRASQEVKGDFTALVRPIDLNPEALAGWGSQPLVDPPKTVRDADPDASPQAAAVESVKSRVEGGLQKRLVNAANMTVTESSAEDPQARGWMRRTRPGACPFCRLVASRGGVYTKASSTFACHEHCYCEAVPAWGGKALPVRPYKASENPSTPADRARVREWIKKNLD